MVTWLETELDRAALANPDPGRPTLHRLNRTEYRNAVRDLLAVDIDAALLPADNAAYGFDNNADALTLSSSLTERYLGAAARIAEMALGRPRGTPAPETILVPTDRDQGVRISDDLPFGSRGGAAFPWYFPADGEYLFQLRPKESGVAGGFEGVTAEPHELHVSIDGARVWTGIVQRPEGARGNERIRLILERMRFRAPVTAGPHLVQAYFTAKTSAYVEDLFDPDLRRDPYRAANGEPVVSSVTITGPMPETASPGDSPSRRKLLVCTPPRDATADEQAACAREIVSTLARRAYRRPVTDADLEIPLSLYREGAARDGFEAGVELAVRGILVSPNFLFRFEDPARVGRSRARRTASRTSSWPRACRSSSGAASPTTSWSTSPSPSGCTTPTCSAGRCGACSRTRGRAPSSTTSPASGCTSATSRASSPAPSCCSTSTTTCARPSSRRPSSSSRASSARTAASSTSSTPTTHSSTSGWPGTTASPASTASASGG